MHEHTHAAGSAPMQAEREALDRAAQKTLEQRRASGETLTHHFDGWVVQEHPGGRIERPASVERFRAEDFPYPGFTWCQRESARRQQPRASSRCRRAASVL